MVLQRLPAPISSSKLCVIGVKLVTPLAKPRRNCGSQTGSALNDRVGIALGLDEPARDWAEINRECNPDDRGFQ
jgi:hypothetical protein